MRVLPGPWKDSYENKHDDALAKKRASNKKGRHATCSTPRESSSPRLGVNPGYQRLDLGAIGEAPFAAVAVDNPTGIVPGCGQRTASGPHRCAKGQQEGSAYCRPGQLYTGQAQPVSVGGKPVHPPAAAGSIVAPGGGVAGQAFCFIDTAVAAPPHSTPNGCY